MLKASDGHGAYWTKAFAEADDFDESNGENILTFFQAQDIAKQLARGGTEADNAPITVDRALVDYRRDLELAQCEPVQRRSPAPASDRALLAKPVQLLDVERTEGMARQPARQDRAGDHQPTLPQPLRGARTGGTARRRITNRDAWETGLAGLPNAQRRATWSFATPRCTPSPRPPMRRSAAWPVRRHAGDDRRAAEPSDAPARRGSAPSPGKAEADDAEVRARAAAETAAPNWRKNTACRSRLRCHSG